jgi:hypothetical protein
VWHDKLSQHTLSLVIFWKKKTSFMQLFSSSSSLMMTDDHKLDATLFRMAHATLAHTTSGSRHHLLHACLIQGLLCCRRRLAALLDLAMP